MVVIDLSSSNTFQICIYLELYYKTSKAYFYRIRQECVIPSIDAEAIFVQSTRVQSFLKPSKPCHVGFHWIALAEYR